MEPITIVGFAGVAFTTLLLVALGLWNLKIIGKIYRRRTTSYREIMKIIKSTKHRKR